MPPSTPKPAIDVCVVYCSCPDEATAERLADALVEEGLAACVNALPQVTSTYRWDGEVQRDVESLLIIKTSRPLLDRLAARIAQLHPYELPEVLAVPCCDGSPAYLDWVRTSVQPAVSPPANP